MHTNSNNTTQEENKANKESQSENENKTVFENKTIEKSKYCRICDTTSTRKDPLNIHNKRMHNNIKEINEDKENSESEIIQKITHKEQLEADENIGEKLTENTKIVKIEEKNSKESVKPKNQYSEEKYKKEKSDWMKNLICHMNSDIPSEKVTSITEPIICPKCGENIKEETNILKH